MGWLFGKSSDKPKKTELVHPLDLMMLDAEAMDTAESEGKQEYYCGLCKCMVPLSSGLHPHTSKEE